MGSALLNLFQMNDLDQYTMYTLNAYSLHYIANFVLKNNYVIINMVYVLYTLINESHYGIQTLNKIIRCFTK